MERLFRCRGCRGALFTSAETSPEPPAGCCRGLAQVRGLPEHQLPGWALAQLEEGGWTRGRLTCPGCGAKLGDFDFEGGGTCDCRSTVLPSVRLASSRVDELPLPAGAHDSPR